MCMCVFTTVYGQPWFISTSGNWHNCIHPTLFQFMSYFSAERVVELLITRGDCLLPAPHSQLSVSTFSASWPPCWVKCHEFLMLNEPINPWVKVLCNAAANWLQWLFFPARVARGLCEALARGKASVFIFGVRARGSVSQDWNDFYNAFYTCSTRARRQSWCPVFLPCFNVSEWQHLSRLWLK